LACASLDWNLGRIIDILKKQNLYENTVIIFASDHGSHFRTRNKDGHLNGYDDYKRTCHDAALRVPLVIRGGPFTGGKVIKDLVSTAGIPKTILSLAGVDPGNALIGENFLDAVNNEKGRLNEVFAQISESRVGRCVRTPDFKYSVYAPGKNGGMYMDSLEYADDFLYDLQKDPFELKNLIKEPTYRDIKLQLKERLLYWIEKEEHKKPVIHD
jgi:uncharacterized sulfatase